MRGWDIPHSLWVAFALACSVDPMAELNAFDNTCFMRYLGASTRISLSKNDVRYAKSAHTGPLFRLRGRRVVNLENVAVQLNGTLRNRRSLLCIEYSRRNNKIWLLVELQTRLHIRLRSRKSIIGSDFSSCALSILFVVIFASGSLAPESKGSLIASTFASQGHFISTAG